MKIQPSLPPLPPIQLYPIKDTVNKVSSDASADGGTLPATASPTAPVTSSPSPSLFTAGTLSGVIAQNEQTDSPALPQGVANMLHDIANNPAFAAQQAQSFASAGCTPCLKAPPAGASDGAVEQFRQMVEAATSANKTLVSQKEGLYQSEMARGTPPARIYADMLSLESSQPQSYFDAVDPNGAANVQGNLQAQLTQLQKDMAAAGIKA